MRRLISGGHGAAPGYTTWRLSPENAPRRVSGRRSSRVSWVGTKWTFVTWWRSIRSRVSAASKRWRMTTDPPDRNGSIEKAHWAEWYAGPQSNVTPSVGTPSCAAAPTATSYQVEAGIPAWVSELRTPLGRPVVP